MQLVFGKPARTAKSSWVVFEVLCRLDIKVYSKDYCGGFAMYILILSKATSIEGTMA